MRSLVHVPEISIPAPLYSLQEMRHMIELTIKGADFTKSLGVIRTVILRVHIKRINEFVRNLK